MKRMRNWIGAGLAVGLALTLGCTNTSPSASGTTGGESPAANGQRLKIGISIPSATHGWTGGVNWWADQMAGIYPNVDFVIMATEDSSKQVSDIETAMAQGLDGLVVLANDSAALTPVAKEVADKGIFLVSVDRGFTEPVADIFLEGDNKAFGRVAAEYIVEKTGGTGNILILEGIPSTVNTDRLAGAMEVFSRNPGIKILDQQPGEWNREKAYEVTQTMLVKHNDVTAIWAADDDMALGVKQALDEKNLSNVWIIGGGGMKDVVKMVKDGNAQFPATVTYSPSMIATGVHLCVSALQGGNVDKKKGYLPRHLKMDVELVTPQNADRFYFPDSTY